MTTVMMVGSTALEFPEPPPDTLTWFTCGEAAFEETFTLTAIGGKLAPGLKTSLREHWLTEHAHPLPTMATRANPAGRLSGTVTHPLKGPAFAALPTVTD